MRLNLKRITIAAVGVLTALAVVVPRASAAATTLNGDWAPFTRCPVQDPSMLAADGTSTIALCLASDSPSGSVTLGKISAPTGDVNLQVGLLENASTGAFTIVSPSGGAISAAPTSIPGGLLGLMCPSQVPIVSSVCGEITSTALNTVTAVVRPAGNPSAFSLLGGLTTGQPIITVPVKIQLQNPLLGSNCYLGSNRSPILLRPENTVAPSISASLFDGDGTPDSSGVMQGIFESGATQGDDSAAIPGASGCGLLGLLDGAINAKVGLPSPAGANHFTLNDASAALAGIAAPGAVAPNDGKLLAQFWNSALRS